MAGYLMGHVGVDWEARARQNGSLPPANQSSHQRAGGPPLNFHATLEAQAETITWQHAEIVKLKRQLGEAATSLVEEREKHAQAKRLIAIQEASLDLSEKEINRLRSELDLFAATQDEGVGG